MDVAYIALVDTCTQDFWSASEDGTSCQQRYWSVITRRVAVASAMFTRRAGLGALKLGGPEQSERGSRLGGSDRKARAEARIEAKAGSTEARRCGSGEVHCHFIAPAPPRKHQELSALYHCRSRYCSSITSACA